MQRAVLFQLNVRLAIFNVQSFYQMHERLEVCNVQSC